MIATLVGLALPIAAAWMVVGRSGLTVGSLLRASLAIPLGLGAASLTTFWLVRSGLPLGSSFVAVDVGIWVLATGLATVFGRPAAAPVTGRPAWVRLGAQGWLVRLGFAAVAVVAAATVVAHYQAAPHGEWDAWAVWNQKARFFVRAGQQWTDGLAINWSNPTHPLMVTTSVVRLWTYAGAELTIAPALLAVLFGAAIVMGVVGALGPRRHRAWIAGAAVMAPGFFPQLVAAQTSDLPISMLVLLTLALIAMFPSDGSEPQRSLGARACAAGALVGIAAWTKNEGFVLFVTTAATVAWLLWRLGSVWTARWWLLGVLPGLVTTIWFKFGIAPAAPAYNVPSMTTQQLVGMFIDPVRHLTIWHLAAPMFARWGGPVAGGSLALLVVALAVQAVRVNPVTWRVLATTVPLALGYYAAYLALPHDTAWLVATTFDRLTLQVWPALVLAAFAERPVSNH